MLKKLSWFFILCANIVLISYNSIAADIFIHSDSQIINLCPYLEVFEDPTGKMALLQILHPDIQDRFTTLRSQQLNLGVTKSTYWFRFRLKMDTADRISEDGQFFYLIYIWSGLSIFFAAWFCRSFLLTPQHAPLIDKIFKSADGKEFSITISIGLAELQHNESSAELIKRADEALYTAKDQGKNRTVG